MRKIGILDIFTEYLEYFKDNDKIVDENQKEIKKEDLEELAVWINSPWSQSNERYKIEVNCKDGYSPIPEGEPVWRCLYTAVGYEATTATIIGYGITPDESLQDCIELFRTLQKEYNPDNESI